MDSRDKSFYVYKWSTEKDGVFYIGKGIDYRINENHKDSPLCYRISQKRIKEGFKIIKNKIYENMIEDEAFAWEVYLIDFYKPRGNLTGGGRGGRLGHKHSEETKKLISERVKAGMTKEVREKISKARIGKPGPWKGKKMPKSACEKMSKAKKGKKLSPEHTANIAKAVRGENNPFYGKKHTEETKIHLRKKAKCGEDNPCAKLTWEKVHEIRTKYVPWEYSQRMLAREYEVSPSVIKNILNGKKWKEE